MPEGGCFCDELSQWTSVIEGSGVCDDLSTWRIGCGKSVCWDTSQWEKLVTVFFNSWSALTERIFSNALFDALYDFVVVESMAISVGQIGKFV